MAISEQVNVKFTREQKEILGNLVGLMGGTEPEVVRTIVIAWLTEKSLINERIKKKIDK